MAHTPDAPYFLSLLKRLFLPFTVHPFPPSSARVTPPMDQPTALNNRHTSLPAGPNLTSLSLEAAHPLGRRELNRRASTIDVIERNRGGQEGWHLHVADQDLGYRRGKWELEESLAVMPTGQCRLVQKVLKKLICRGYFSSSFLSRHSLPSPSARRSLSRCGQVIPYTPASRLPSPSPQEAPAKVFDFRLYER